MYDFLYRQHINFKYRGRNHLCNSPLTSFASHVLCLYPSDISRGSGNNFQNLSWQWQKHKPPAQFSNQDWKWERDMALLGPYGHIQLDKKKPRLSLPVHDAPKQVSFECQIIDSFCDGISVLQMNLNQHLAIIFKSFFSIGTPASICRGVVSEINITNQPFKSSRVFF